MILSLGIDTAADTEEWAAEKTFPHLDKYLQATVVALAYCEDRLSGADDLRTRAAFVARVEPPIKEWMSRARGSVTPLPKGRYYITREVHWPFHVAPPPAGCYALVYGLTTAYKSGQRGLMDRVAARAHELADEHGWRVQPEQFKVLAHDLSPQLFGYQCAIVDDEDRPFPWRLM